MPFGNDSGGAWDEAVDPILKNDLADEEKGDERLAVELLRYPPAEIAAREATSAPVPRIVLRVGVIVAVSK